MTDSPDAIYANARLVLENEVITGALMVREGRIAALDHGAQVPAGAIDCAGDFLAPGLIELHTDNIERHLQPRPGVKWPARAAVIAHDAELAAMGITTVFDALRVGSLVSNIKSKYERYARPLCDEILSLRAAGAFRITHFLHLRAEICSETLLEELAEFSEADNVGIVSLMDHTPGQRQFKDIAQMRRYLSTKYAMSDSDLDTHFALLKGVSERYGPTHEAGAVDHARRLGAILASHDDTEVAHVTQSARRGAKLAEFPTTLHAARACHAAGIAVMMGAPNLLRGGSHSGNVAAQTLADAGMLDILSSDYAPSSLLMAATKLGQEGGDMAKGIATVTTAPARAAGLEDRGRLAPGLRADLIRFRMEGTVPLLSRTLCGGRIAA